MANIKMKVLNDRERESRNAYLIAYHMKNTKRKGDWHFRMAELLGADSDYIPGVDDGEPRQN